MFYDRLISFQINETQLLLGYIERGLFVYLAGFKMAGMLTQGRRVVPQIFRNFSGYSAICRGFKV